MPVELLVDDAIDLGDAVSAQDLTAWADAVARHTGDLRMAGDVCVRVCAPDEIAALNAEFRGEHKPTNVLSFPADADYPGGRILGDVAICWPVVQREAADQTKSERDHFAHLYIHGLLHLLGHDHEEADAAERMERLEAEVLAELGIADPYLPCI